METRLPAKGWESLYEVTDKGRVWSVRRNKYLKATPHKPGGALYVDLCRADGKRHSIAVHHLVLETFVEPKPFSGAMGLHWDDDPQNNDPSNLRWETRGDNTRDSVRNGRHNQARKTHCPAKHEYTEANTYRAPDGSRQCRACQRGRMRVTGWASDAGSG